MAMATQNNLSLFITITSILVLFPPISSAPVVPDCPYPPFPETLCSTTRDTQDQLWCSSGVTLRVKICETLLSPSNGHQVYDTLMKDFRVNASDTSRTNLITGFCENVTLIRGFLKVTLSSSLDSATDILQPEKCKEMCTKSKVCGLTLLSFKFLGDLITSISKSAKDESADQPKNPVVPNPNDKIPEIKPAQVSEKVKEDKNTSSRDKVPSSPPGLSSPAPVVEDDEIPIPDNVIIPEQTKVSVDKKVDPIEPPNAAQVNELVKEKELQEKKEEEEKSGHPGQGQVSSSSPSSSLSQVGPIPAVANPNSAVGDKSSTTTAAGVDKTGQVNPGAVLPPPQTNQVPDNGPKIEDRSPVPPVGKMSKADEPLPPESDIDTYKDDKVDMDALGPPEDPGVEEDDNGGGVVQKGNVIPVPEPDGKRKSSNEIEHKPDEEKVRHRYSQIPDHGDPYLTDLNQEESGYFNYFITLLGFLFVGFILFHNKKRLIAFLIEGRRPAGTGRRTRRRSTSGGNSSAYRKLENNFD